MNGALSVRSRLSVLGWVLIALSGGLWGALLGRLLFELFPLWFSWRYSSTLVLGLVCAALAPPLARAAGRRETPARLAERSWPLALGLAYMVQPAVAPLWGGAALIAGLGGALWLTRARAAVPGSAFRDGLAPPGKGEVPSGAAERANWVWDLAIFCTALVVYVATLSPSVLPGDSGEFQLVAPTLGVPHPTGYPLYVVLGKLLTWVPLGSVAYRVNLFSAIAASIAVWAIYRAGRALALWRPAALLGAGLLLVSDAFWSQAVIAEKYALHAAFVALTLWLGLRWRAADQAGHEARGWLTAWALVYGLSLTHHRTMLLLAPAYLALIWFTDRDSVRPALFWRPLLAGLLPLLLYGLLPLFSALDPPYAFVRIDSMRAFFDLVLARAYQGGLLHGGGLVHSLAGLSGRAKTFAPLIVSQFEPLGLVLALAGWTLLLRRQRLVAWVILGGMVAHVGFALNYDVPNAPIYLLPVYVWLAPCAAVAVDAVLRHLERPLPLRPRLARARPHFALAWLLLVVALPVGLCAARWQGMDQRRGYAAYAFGHAYEQLVLTAVEPGAVLVSDWLPATALWYGQWVEGRAPGVQVLSVDSLELQWRGPVQAALAAGRPVYLSRPVIEAGVHYALASAGPLVRVLPTVETTPPSRPAIPVDPGASGEVELIGYDWRAVRPGPEGELYTPQQGSLEGGSTLEVTLFWRALDAPSADYAVTVGIADADGRLRAQRQSRHPVGGTYPTSHWRPGQVVADAYRLELPPALPSGRYQLVAAMGPPGAGSGTSDAKDVDRLLLGEVKVDKPLRWPYASLSVPVRQRCSSDLVLLGHDAPPRAAAGEMVDVAVQWLVTGDGAGHDIPALFAVQADGSARQAVMWHNNPADWRRGAVVVAQYTVDTGDTLRYLELRGDGWAYRLPTRPGAGPAIVADLQVIRLRDYRYATQELHPGETVRLTLNWEAMADIDERYKVFVHVLGQNGLPVAQQDSEPVNGTHPTMRWRRGERISDPYAFALPEALAPGTYAVEVGLYRISDLTRLPVLDETGASIDDKVYLAPITVK